MDRNNAISFIDIITNSEKLDAFGIEFNDAVRILHAVNAQGRVIKGVSAFVAIWQLLPTYRILYFFSKLPGVTSLLNVAYLYFANWRYDKRMQQLTCRAVKK